ARWHLHGAPERISCSSSRCAVFRLHGTSVLWHLVSMPTIRLLAVVATTLFLVGCFQSTALVKVNADGSGTLEHRTTMTGAAAAQLRQLAGMFGQAGDKPIDPFSEEDARVSATKMGEGVTLLSTTALKTLDAEGR